MSLVETKVFNAAINNKPFFDRQVKTKLVKMLKNNHDATRNLLS